MNLLGVSISFYPCLMFLPISGNFLPLTSSRCNINAAFPASFQVKSFVWLVTPGLCSQLLISRQSGTCVSPMSVIDVEVTEICSTINIVKPQTASLSPVLHFFSPLLLFPCIPGVTRASSRVFIDNFVWHSYYCLPHTLFYLTPHPNPKL